MRLSTGCLRRVLERGSPGSLGYIVVMRLGGASDHC